MNKGGYQVYQQTNIMTADAKRLIIMCYEEAIYSLKSAKNHFINQDYVAKGQAVQKAIDILNELRVALNFEKGGIIAKNLDLLYGFLISYILNGDVKKDTKAFEQAASILSELKSAWEQILGGNAKRENLYAYETQPSIIS
ncbi:MAG: flagellar export chaperone FliS [Thermodesulfobacteriota bacterium]